jgi:C4-dicarboxylate-specific signal transduction histidine kinase
MQHRTSTPHVRVRARQPVRGRARKPGETRAAVQGASLTGPTFAGPAGPDLVGTTLAGPQLAAAIAHEIDQPLAAIALHGELALRSLGREHPASAAVLSLLAACDNASAILRAMRLLAEPAAFAPEPCKLDDAVDAVLTAAAGRLARHGVQVDLDLPANLPALLSHPIQLQQLLRNLVDNAIEAATAGGAAAAAPRLRITARGSGRQLIVTVADNGCGLPPGAPLFAAGFTTRAGSHGMGLAICAAIAEAHGGAIKASPADGGGALFELRFCTA